MAEETMTAQKPGLLLIDDGTNYAGAIFRHMPEFELLLFNPETGAAGATDGPAALKVLAERRDDVDVVLLDMHFDIPDERLFPLEEGASARRTRRFQGVAILREIRARYPHLPVVLLTAHEDLSLVDAAGHLTSQSMTYILDGDDLDTLRVRIHTAMEDAAQQSEETRILWGDSPAMKHLRRRLSVLARGAMPVILEGETGTGKSWLAEKFVHARSGRTGPFVVLDLSTVPPDLISAHLFGSEKGAYTGATETRRGVFELAHGGTLFIDEIQNAPIEVQKQLLLVLQDRRVRPLGASREIVVDVKVIAASNSPLDEAVRNGTFRPDLYMRLSPATRLRIPPLRERIDDLEFLARRFADKALVGPDAGPLKDEVVEALGLPAETSVRLTVGRGARGPQGASLEIFIPRPAWHMLLEHPWPGNIRELEMLMHNLITFTLVDALEAVRKNAAIASNRLQVDPGLIGNLLAGASALGQRGREDETDADRIAVDLRPGQTLNDVSRDVEKQVFLTLYRRCNRDFAAMAQILLGDGDKARAVRLRFNQLGLRVRELDHR